MNLIAWIFLFSLPGWADGDANAVNCIEQFVAKMATAKGYSIRLNKRELFEGKFIEEPIDLWVEGPQVKYKFVADGSTGIKNNGMELIYDGSDNLKIIWGKPTMLGSIANRAARAVVGDSLSLVDERALKGEYFTLNRAGFRHLALSLKHHLPALRSEGGLTHLGQCQVKHTPLKTVYATITLKPEDRISDLEEKYGTFALHILHANATQFADFKALFHRSQDFEIRVPLFPMSFELNLDDATYLPQKLILYRDDEKIGEYEFSDVKIW